MIFEKYLLVVHWCVGAHVRPSVQFLGTVVGYEKLHLGNRFLDVFAIPVGLTVV